MITEALIWCALVVRPIDVPEALNRMTLARGREAKIVPMDGDWVLIVFRAPSCGDPIK